MHSSRRPTFRLPPFSVTTQNVDTGRVNLQQDLKRFTLGPFRVVPYAVLDLAAYNDDLLGDSRGRVLGGSGACVRAFPSAISIRMSKASFST